MSRLGTSYAHQSALLRTRSTRVTALLGAAALIAAPFVLGRYWLNIAVLAGLAVIGAGALNLLQGVAGQVSIGNAAFMAIGGFTVGIMAVENDVPGPVAVLCAGIVAAFVGALAGLPALRLRGFYLAISTLALHYVTMFAASEYQKAHVGPAGYHPRALTQGWGGLDFTQTWYMIVIAVAVGSMLLIASLMRTRFGRAWKAIHHRDIAAELLGVRVTEYKVLVFAVSSFLIGIQGALFVYYIGVVSFETYTFDLAVTFVAMIIIGGQGSILGTVLGALFVTGLPFAVKEAFTHLPEKFLGISAADVFDVQALIYGVSIMAFLLFEPNGLAAILGRVKRWFTSWPMSREISDAHW